jgi:uncharacterized protein YjbJ (UPF0337 family)
MSEDVAGSRTPQEEALAEEIERTRQQLGGTVEALAAKADVKGRAQRRAAEVTGNLRGKARAARDKVAGQARDRAAAAGRGVREAAPAAQRSAGQAVATAREHGGKVAVAVAVAVLAWLAVRRLRN